MMSLVRSRYLAPMVLLSFALAARAVIFEPLSIESMTAKADVVIHGTVLAKSCQRGPDGRIFTRVEIQVADLWKGAISSTPLVITLGGGVLGDRKSTVSGQVEYGVGEEVVAFLVRNDRGEHVTLGLAQGKFHVFLEAAGTTKLVASPFYATALRTTAKSGRTTASLASTPLTLGELKQRVTEAVR